MSQELHVGEEPQGYYYNKVNTVQLFWRNMGDYDFANVRAHGRLSGVLAKLCIFTWVAITRVFNQSYLTKLYISFVVFSVFLFYFTTIGYKTLLLIE